MQSNVAEKNSGWQFFISVFSVKGCKCLFNTNLGCGWEMAFFPPSFSTFSVIHMKMSNISSYI